MLIKIRFLGVLSSNLGSKKIVADIDPDYGALQAKIVDLIGDTGVANFVVLKKGVPINKETDIIAENDEFCVFIPISGG